MLDYSIESIAVMSPTFRLAPASWFAFVNHLARCAKGRLEVRECELKLGCHVPVGVLESLQKDHVDYPSVQQTLAILDNFVEHEMTQAEEI